MVDEMTKVFGLDSREGREALAREKCFMDCAAGHHLDFESGVISVCKSSAECQGWHAYLNHDAT